MTTPAAPPGDLDVYTTYRAAAAAAGVTPATIRRWITRGWLPAPPWGRADLAAAAASATRPPGTAHGSLAAHGTASRWTAGCHCADCTAAHNAATLAAHDTARQADWDAGRADTLIAALAGGADYRAGLTVAATSAPAVAGQRRRDPTFAARLDAALTAGRRPDLAHGRAGAWKAGCRCPDCRTWHDASRSPRCPTP